MELKKDWSEKDFDLMKKTICHFFHNNDYEKIDKLFGLAYTSTSSVTGLYICNLQIFLDACHKYEIIAFCIGTDGTFYAFCDNENEDELFVTIY